MMILPYILWFLRVNLVENLLLDTNVVALEKENQTLCFTVYVVELWEHTPKLFRNKNDWDKTKSDSCQTKTNVIESTTHEIWGKKFPNNLT